MFECQVALALRASGNAPQYKGPRVGERLRPLDGMVVDIAEGLAVGGGDTRNSGGTQPNQSRCLLLKARPLTWFQSPIRTARFQPS